MMFANFLYNKFVEWLREDIPYWDLTTEAIVPNTNVRAVIKAKSNAIIACIEDLIKVLEKLNIKAEKYLSSGTFVRAGDEVATLIGSAKSILSVERTLLNLLIYLSAVATTTRMFVNTVKRVDNRVKIAATRKTIPGLRDLTKKAVKIGGGDTHRLSLSDAILIKDNHIRLVGSVSKAIKLAKENMSFIHKIEVEVSSVDEVIEAAVAGADIVMLDNFTPNEVKDAVRELCARGLRDNVIIEVSGGITFNNVMEYASTGVDIISTSIITMNPVKVDMSMDILGEASC